MNRFQRAPLDPCGRVLEKFVQFRSFLKMSDKSRGPVLNSMGIFYSKKPSASTLKYNMAKAVRARKVRTGLIPTDIHDRVF